MTNMRARIAAIAFLGAFLGIAMATPAAADTCFSFDPGKASIMNIGGEWSLREGITNWIAKLGPGENEPKRQEAIVKYYRMTSHCFASGSVNDPNTFNYWLVNGGAPHGGSPGGDCIFFNDIAKLQIKSDRGQYLVIDGNHQWRAFPTYNAAQEAIRIIQQYGFRAACYAVRPQPVMTYFVQ
jgi:hypothetical protein